MESGTPQLNLGPSCCEARPRTAQPPCGCGDVTSTKPVTALKFSIFFYYWNRLKYSVDNSCNIQEQTQQPTALHCVVLWWSWVFSVGRVQKPIQSVRALWYVQYDLTPLAKPLNIQTLQSPQRHLERQGGNGPKLDDSLMCPSLKRKYLKTLYDYHYKTRKVEMHCIVHKTNRMESVAKEQD